MTQICIEGANGSVENGNDMDPRYSPEVIDERGLFDLPNDGLVSSLALTPDGCYVFAGFGGGEVRMYAQALRTVGAASRSGTIVAQIKSKGMFSNTKVECHVEATEDGRFVFAGLLRGSSEMLALDIADLPRWSTLPTPEEASLAASRFNLNRRIRTYAHSDGKLKGFGAAAVARTGPNRTEWGSEYRLFCGRGIKNIHIWSFKPAYAVEALNTGDFESGRKVGGRNGGSAADGWGAGGEWVCLYDTPTNGATVELVAFRNGGFEGISKSTDANVRVWDLSDDTNAKPPFREVSNSKDTRVVFGDYAYGGTTVLSLVKIDEPAVANRTEIGLPESGTTAQGSGRTLASSSRGKRHCRMLKDLAGTQDGRHVVLVCSDGTVLYHRHTQETTMMKLQPLEGLGLEEEDVRATVALSLCGRSGLPALMIAYGRGNPSVASNGGEDVERQLALMALPRSEAQHLEDAQHGKLLRERPSLGRWPQGQKINPDEDFSDEDEDEDEDDSGSEVDAVDEALCSNGVYVFSAGAERKERIAKSHGERAEVSRVHAFSSDRYGRSAIVNESDEESEIAISRPISRISHPRYRQDAYAYSATAEHECPQVDDDEEYEFEGFNAASIPLVAVSGPTFVSGSTLRARRKRVANGRKGRSKGLASVNRADEESRGRSVGGSPITAGTADYVKQDDVEIHTTPASSSLRGVDIIAKFNPGGYGDVLGTSGAKPRGSAEKSALGNLAAAAAAALAAATAGSVEDGDEGTLEEALKGTLDFDDGIDGLRRKTNGVTRLYYGGESEGRERRKDIDKTAPPVANVPLEATTEPAAGGTGSISGEASSDTLPEIMTQVQELTSTEHSDEKAKKRSNSFSARIGAGTGALGRGGIAGKRPGKKRAREDAEKVPGDDDTGREGAARSGKARRSNPQGNFDDDSVEKTGVHEGGTSSSGDANAGGSGQGGSGSSGNSGHSDQLLLRDRRSRIAARALRSNGSVVDMEALVRGMGLGGGWLSGGRQEVEELRVVRVQEREGGVEPDPVPLVLASFLATRQERRRREVTPVSLERARARHSLCMARLPSASSTFVGAVGPLDGDEATRRDVPPGSTTLRAATITSEVTREDTNSGVTLEAVPEVDVHKGEPSKTTGVDTLTSSHDSRALHSAPVPNLSRAFEDEKSVIAEGGKPTASSDHDVVATSESQPTASLEQSPKAGLLDADGCKEGSLVAADGTKHGVGKWSEIKLSVTLGAGSLTGDPLGLENNPTESMGVEPRTSASGTPSGEVARRPSPTNASMAETLEKHDNSDIGPHGRGLGLASSADRRPGQLVANETAAKEEARERGAESLTIAGGPDVFPPPMEAVIDMPRADGERGSGSSTTDRMYSAHCLEREATARAFFQEQDVLRRRFQAAVDLLELDKAVESAGLGLRSGCRTVQTVKMRLKSGWKDAAGNGVHRCTSKEAHQASQRFQEQMRHVISDHKELLQEMLGRQRLEAGALQMSQEMEVPKGSAPLLEVRCAFPGMFGEVAQRHRIAL